MALLDDTKLYLKEDSSERDNEIQDFIDSAEDYLTNAGITKDETKKLYCLAVKMLVNHWYNNRDAVITGTISKSLEYSLQNIITQLKYNEEVVL